MAQPLPPLTDFARKYGVSEAQSSSTERKSGLSPLFPKRGAQSAQEEQQEEDIYSYQEAELNGYKSYELKCLEAIDQSRVIRSNLNGELHEMVAQAKWDSGGLYLDGESSSLWDAENPEAWYLLLPSLELVSRILDHAHLWPW